MKPFFGALVFSLMVCFIHASAAETTALDSYVQKQDPSYGFVLEETRTREGYTVFVLNMTSQVWRSPAEVDRTLWQHEVLIAVPWVTHSGNQNTALLIVNGGGNNSSSTTEKDRLLGILATVTGSVAVIVSQVPNQPLLFTDESETRIEDELLAYGMDKYLNTGDPEWLVHLPMTKAVVRAMDTVQTFAAEADFAWPLVPRIDDFIVLGGSKRGWATWLTAAVEAQKGSASRVKAIVPASIDLLNLDQQFAHHWEAYGFYAPAVGDYAAFDLPCRALTPAGQAMLSIIDPYAYRHRLTMPKLVLNSAGDQFFLPDSSRFYFDDLPGPKHLRYTLNTDHSQGQNLADIILPTLSWLSDALDDDVSSLFTWQLEADGAIRVQTNTQPERVRLWQATNPDARDFRLETIGAAWTSSELLPSAPGEYIGYVPPPAQGWTAFTVELTFPGSTVIPTPLESAEIFTTDVRVTPADLPYRGTSCPEYQAPTVMAVAGSGGTVAPDWQYVAPNAAAQFTVRANSGYVLNNTVGGTCPQGSWNGDTWTTGPINASCTVSFSFHSPSRFSDVPDSFWARQHINAIADAGISTGCGGGKYCPESLVSRAEMAALLLRGSHGGGYAPPTPKGTAFRDVPKSYWAAGWIEQLATEGVTLGCGGGRYCPEKSVTRAEMAVFLLRSKHGSSYTPPTANGMRFKDVPKTYWAANWIEKLAADGVTTGCGGGNYCPENSVTRAEMAVFLARTFDLVLQP